MLKKTWQYTTFALIQSKWIYLQYLAATNVHGSAMLFEIVYLLGIVDQLTNLRLLQYAFIKGRSRCLAVFMVYVTSFLATVTCSVYTVRIIRLA